MDKQINAVRFYGQAVAKDGVFLILALLSSALCALAQYRPIDLPKTLTFTKPTPAYDPENPKHKLGDFQAGIRVNVLGSQSDPSLWRVSYERYGQAALEALIESPDLSATEVEAYKRVHALISEFPLLQTLLETENPWPKEIEEQARQIFGHEKNFTLASGSKDSADVLTAKSPKSFWGIQPLASEIRYTDPKDPRVLIEVWNKGDAHRSRIRPTRARLIIRENLEKIQSAFPTMLQDPAPSMSITALKIQEEVFLLPNDLRVSLRYKSGEYLLLSLQSIRYLEDNKPGAFDPETFTQRIASKVTTSEDGHRYIDSIPMIDQGEKGYCAAATLARVLQFYGYPIDMHALADLAETEGRGGTRRDEIIRAMRRICNSTPFKLRELKDPDPGLLREKIEKGVPLIWFVPGHARLLIGIHPENSEIVYSDTYGLAHQYTVGDWVYFMNNNKEIWTLLPEGHL
ncbi:MAG: hypothetical protein CBC33_001615 [Coraliomargarita sp. TMED73]|nr:MAG: hypothetical protein CBC33_001615 [Coraliomargarita sp. TMED73]